MGLPILFFTTLIALVSTIGYFNIDSEVRSSIKIVADSKIDTNLISYLEHYRALVRKIMAEHKLSSGEMAAGIRCHTSNDCDGFSLYGYSERPEWARDLVQPTRLGSEESDVYGWATGVSDSGAPEQTMSVELFVREKGQPEITPSQVTKNLRLRLGQSTVFKNSLTGNSFACIFCHARIMGDVANYAPAGMHAAQSTIIDGTYITGTGAYIPSSATDTISVHSPYDPHFVLTDYPHDESDLYDDHYMGYPMRLNVPTTSLRSAGHTLTGTDRDSIAWNTLYTLGLKHNYLGPSLPWNFNRQKMMLPKFDPERMFEFARGSLSGLMIKVPMPSVYAGQNLQVGEIDSHYEGHLILDGRQSPIQINGRIFIQGDLIIMGRVSGQGELYSGRNIYIADDLTYANPPPHFDGSEASNRKMHQVSIRGRLLAAEMKDYDRLALFATNNIILGSPFSAQEDVPDGDLMFMNASAITKYSLARELAYDPANGQMYDRELLTPNKVCYIKPWESLEDCRTFSGEYPDNSGSVQVTPILDAHAVPAKIAPNDREHYTRHRRPMTLDRNYEINFLPNRFNGGTPQRWIQEDDYHRLANDSNAKNAAEALDGYGRRLRIYQGSSPFPHSTRAYSSDALNAVAIYNMLEDEYGIISALNNANVRVLRGSPLQPAGYLVSDLLLNFLGQCSLSLTGNGSPYHPYTGFHTRNRNNLTSIAGLQPMVLNGTNTGAYPNNFYCHFDFGPENTNTDGSVGNVSASVSHYGYPSSNGQNFNLALPATGITRLASWAQVQSATAGVVTPPMFTFSDGSPFPLAVDHTRATHNSSLAVTIRLGVAEAQYNDVHLRSRYYSNQKVKYRNKIKKVQAFLFANQFVTYAFSSGFDRQLRLHGGVVSKDFFGRFANYIGPERQKVKNRFIASSASSPLHTTGGSTLWGAFPALFVISDPRFQFTTELVGADMLDVVGVE